MKRVVYPAVLLLLLSLLTACGSYAEFTVVNTTGEAMTAGWSYNGCPRQNGPPPLLRESKPVAAQAEASFERVTASQANCVMVTNATGSIRLYTAYQDGDRYVVAPDLGSPSGLSMALDPASPAGAAPIAPEQTVPSALTYALVFALALGGFASAVIVLGYYRSQRRRRSRRLIRPRSRGAQPSRRRAA